MVEEKDFGRLEGIVDVTRQELKFLQIKVDSEITSIRNEFKEIKREIKDSSDESKKISDESKKEIKNDIKDLKTELGVTLQDIKDDLDLSKKSISDLNTHKNKLLGGWQTMLYISGSVIGTVSLMTFVLKLMA